MILQEMQAPPEGGQLQYHNPRGMSLKDSDERKSLQETVLKAAHLERDVARRGIIYRFTRFGQQFGWIVRESEGT